MMRREQLSTLLEKHSRLTFYLLQEKRGEIHVNNHSGILRRSIVRKEDAPTFSNKKYIFQVSK
jgi:hypothetical protein